MTESVTRMGNVVHRTHNANSDYVKAVLTHLERKGAEFSPRWLGMDSQGRDMFSYIQGHVPGNLGFYSDTQCVAATRLISHMHALLRDMPGCPHGMTVCHRDLSPCNFVFDDSGMPVGIIDWDAAAPGDPLCDFAYAMWMWLDIGNDDQNARYVARRMRIMRASYIGMSAVPMEIIYDAMLGEMARVGRGVFPTEEQTRATSEWTRRCAAWCEQNRRVLLSDCD